MEIKGVVSHEIFKLADYFEHILSSVNHVWITVLFSGMRFDFLESRRRNTDQRWDTKLELVSIENDPNNVNGYDARVTIMVRVYVNAPRRCLWSEKSMTVQQRMSPMGTPGQISIFNHRIASLLISKANLCTIIPTKMMQYGIYQPSETNHWWTWSGLWNADSPRLVSSNTGAG